MVNSNTKGSLQKVDAGIVGLEGKQKLSEESEIR